jgi:hypothetical protein
VELAILAFQAFSFSPPVQSLSSGSHCTTPSGGKGSQVSVGQFSYFLAYGGFFPLHRRMLGVPVGVPSKITLLRSVSLPSAPIAAQDT